MEHEEIDRRIEDQIEKWLRSQRHFERKIDVTSGAKSLLKQTVINIQADPSPDWILPRDATDDVQQQTIDMIPAMLNRVIHPYPRSAFPSSATVSSWELLHAATNILDWFCPIPKR